VVKTA